MEELKEQLENKQITMLQYIKKLRDSQDHTTIE